MTYDFEMRIVECPRTIGGARLFFDCEAQPRRGKPDLPPFEVSVPLIDAMRGVFPKEVVGSYWQFEKEALKNDVWSLARVFHAAKLPEILSRNNAGAQIVHPPVAAEPAMK